MAGNSLYEKIVEALKKSLDGHKFQACSTFLLGKVYPNLTPMSGGDDAGMDGAFGTEDGPFPLICTVHSNVIGNLRKNLSTYLQKRTGPKRAVLATSRFLTNRKRRNLEDAASELGVQLVNVHDGSYFADALYRDSEWRLKLLGISGDPPALSILPRTGRFSDPNVLIGRDEDLACLKDCKCDALLVGQPGSGKTYLHQQMARDGLCVFAVDPSLARLADAIREQQPQVIVVDDAHFNLTLVEDLKRLRAEQGAKFHLHLNCWPGHEQSVQRILDIPDTQIRQLKNFKKKEILELIEQLGINGPDWLQALLIEQSDRKPGLAVALVEACKKEDLSKIWGGEVVARQLLGDQRVVSSEKEKCVLAAFAVGGDTGMLLCDVSNNLKISMPELREIVTNLGAGGLIDEINEDRLQVRPPAIRPILVRDAFFSGAKSLPIQPLLTKTKSLSCTASELFSARQRGAKVPLEMLEQFMVSESNVDLWEHFGHIDKECANVVLEKYPGQVCAAAPGLLNFEPNRTLNALLDADEVGDIHSGAIENPRRRISEWMFPYEARPELTIERREELLNVLEDRVRRNKIGKGESFAWALSEILQLAFDIVRPSPGKRFEVRCIRGVVSVPIIKKIVEFWLRIKELLPKVPASAIHVFWNQIEKWCLPQRLSGIGKVSDEAFGLVKSNGQSMLTDMLQLPNCNRAMKTRAARISKWGELGVEVSVDPTFDALYADRETVQNWQEQEINRRLELSVISENLLRQPMTEVLQYLATIRDEAITFGLRSGNGWLWVVYECIANKCQAPEDWIDALVAQEAPTEFVNPFLARLFNENQEQYKRKLKSLLDSPRYMESAIGHVLFLPSPGNDLFESALERIKSSENVEHFCWRDSGIPIETLERLLTHPDHKVRAAAAMGEWQKNPAGTVRQKIEEKWRAAIADVDPNHYALVDVFEKRPSMAFEWLQSQLKSHAYRLSEHDQGFVAAAKLLDKNQRVELLNLLDSKNYNSECFDLIIGEHTDLFATWIKIQPNKYFQLSPLHRDADSRWREMALIALNTGVIKPEELPYYCMSTGFSYVGPLSRYFSSKIPIYEALANDPDPRLRPAGRHGVEVLRRRFEEELRTEEREEM